MMPEISLSTNAGGWFNSGTNVACPMHACQAAKDIPNDINNKQILPIIMAVIQDLQSIFSSKYIHLGSDARQESMACFREARIQPDFLMFEEHLATLMGLEGILPHHVVRWGNKNNELYPGRFGSVTQCRPGELCHAMTNGNESTTWFGTVNLREGGAWNIYQSTRRVALSQPEAILADFDQITDEYFHKHQIPLRLLAFTLGTTNMARIVMNRTAFEQEYTIICKSYFSASNYSYDCERFAASDDGIFETPFYDDDQVRQGACEIRAFNSSRPAFRKAISPYFT